MDEDQGSRLYAESAEYLLKYARQSPEVCDVLVRIVEHWPRKREWVPLYCLAFGVVCDLVIDERLTPDQETLVVRSIVETWLLHLGATDDTEACPAIPDEIIEDMNWPLWWLCRRKPAVLLRECYSRLCDDPESYSGIHSLLDGWNEREDAIMATWLKSKHWPEAAGQRTRLRHVSQTPDGGSYERAHGGRRRRRGGGVRRRGRGIRVIRGGRGRVTICPPG